jgi:hypothetical protein
LGTLGCGFDEMASSREAACVAPLVTGGGASEGVGDVGICFELCDLTDPCAQPEWQCLLGQGLPGGRGVCQFVGTAAGAGGSP